MSYWDWSVLKTLMHSPDQSWRLRWVSSLCTRYDAEKYPLQTQHEYIMGKLSSTEKKYMYLTLIFLIVLRGHLNPIKTELNFFDFFIFLYFVLKYAILKINLKICYTVSNAV